MARKRTGSRCARYNVEVQATLWKSGGSRAAGLQTRTKNISKTGLYLYGDFDGPLNSPFQFEVHLPVPLAKWSSGAHGGVLRGQGKLVRRDLLDGKRIGFAVRIFKCDFHPDPEPGPKTAKPGSKTPAPLRKATDLS